MKLADFDYALPPQLIAQHPARQRGASRLLHLDGQSGELRDLGFTDLPGLWHHISFPIQQLEEKSFEDGFGIDGSSIRGWASIHESDMLLVPDPKTAFMDPFRDTPGRSVKRRSRIFAPFFPAYSRTAFGSIVPPRR